MFALNLFFVFIGPSRYHRCSILQVSSQHSVFWKIRERQSTPSKHCFMLLAQHSQLYILVRKWHPYKCSQGSCALWLDTKCRSIIIFSLIRLRWWTVDHKCTSYKGQKAEWVSKSSLCKENHASTDITADNIVTMNSRLEKAFTAKLRVEKAYPAPPPKMLRWKMQEVKLCTDVFTKERWGAWPRNSSTSKPRWTRPPCRLSLFASWRSVIRVRSNMNNGPLPTRSVFCPFKLHF